MLSITSSSMGVSSGGVHSDRTGTYVVTWNAGEPCANIDGSLTSVVNSADVLTFSAFRVCTTGCPPSGSVANVDPTTGVTTTWVYNGTDTIGFTTSAGGSGVSTITCQ
jgi:hypothetical protein